MPRCKKLLSLFLVMVMLAGLMTVPSLALNGPSGINITENASGTRVKFNLAILPHLDGDRDVCWAVAPATVTYADHAAVSAGANSVQKHTIVKLTGGTTKTIDYVVDNLAKGLAYKIWASVEGVAPISVEFIAGAENTGFKKDINDYKVGITAATPVKAATDGQDATLVSETTPTAATLYIDLSEETITIPETFEVAAYSLDGGKKWTAKPLASGDISKLLNKGMELHLTDAYDKKAKAPQGGVAFKAAKEATDTEETVPEVKLVPAATLVTFPKIEARPKMDKLVVNYLVGADTSGKTNGTWMLTTKDAATLDANGQALIDSLQTVEPKGKKFDPEQDKWCIFTGGIPVKNMENGKAVKTTYFYRSAPIKGETIVPASKTMKVTASSVVKAPALKPDYKKEALKTKKDMMLYFGPRDVGTEANDVPNNTKGGGKILAKAAFTIADGKILEHITDKAAEAGGFYGPVDPTDKDPIRLGGYLGEKDTYITVWVNATVKKPASMKQEITLAPRAYLDNSVIAGEKGKIKMDKTLEVYDSAKSKYGKLPKATAEVKALPIRLKNTAKAGGADKTKATLAYEGLAASAEGEIDVSYGVYDTKLDKDGNVKSEKSGYLTAGIIAPQYSDRIALVRPKLVTPMADGKPVPIAFGAADPTQYSVVYEVVAPNGITNVLQGIIFTDTNNETPLVTHGDVGGDLVYTAANPNAAPATPATLKIKIKTIAGAGTVKFGPDQEANADGTENEEGVFHENGVLAGYAGKLYCAPLSFDIGKAVLNPQLAATGASLTQATGNTPASFANLNAQTTVTISGLGTGLVSASKLTAEVTADQEITVGNVTAATETLTFTLSPAAAATDKKVSIKLGLTTETGKNYEFSADTIEIAVAQVTPAAPPAGG